jgi:3-oxoacyl-[acyl-carrier-protein] synthase II
MASQLAGTALRRVVVTGVGIVSPLGLTTAASWQALLHGQSGIERIRTLDITHLPVQIAAQVDRPGARNRLETRVLAVEPARSTQHLTWSERRLTPADILRAPLSIQYALLAAHEALEDAALLNSLPAEWGVIIGSGMVSLPDLTESVNRHQEGKHLSPHFVPRILLNAAAGYVSLWFGLTGPNLSPSTACAAGAHAIGDAYRLIQRGDASVCLAGGTESCLHELALLGFARARALTSQFNDRPALSSRPFDRQRSGFVLGEGSCLLVLEEYEHARARGRGRLEHIYGEVVGYGMSSDAYHVTAPHPSGAGAQRCMELALSDLARAQVGYVNAHATSTVLGDWIEATAIGRVFAKEARGPLVTSTKGATGHLLGAAGALEAAFTLLALRHQAVPGTLNLFDLDVGPEAASLRFIGHGEQHRWSAEEPLSIALCNSFGFYGTNSCLAFCRMQP